MMMRLGNYIFVTVLTAMVFAVPVSQAKGPPEGKGKGKVPEMTTSSDAEELAKEKTKEAEELKEQQMTQQKKKLNRLEKQKTKKTEQVQKEAGKGSEKGQAMRDQHRKKWWKLWGGDDNSESETAE
jgi:hypothetical protein